MRQRALNELHRYIRDNFLCTRRNLNRSQSVKLLINIWHYRKSPYNLTLFTQTHVSCCTSRTNQDSQLLVNTVVNHQPSARHWCHSPTAGNGLSKPINPTGEQPQRRCPAAKHDKNNSSSRLHEQLDMSLHGLANTHSVLFVSAGVMMISRQWECGLWQRDGKRLTASCSLCGADSWSSRIWYWEKASATESNRIMHCSYSKHW